MVSQRKKIGDKDEESKNEAEMPAGVSFCWSNV